MKVWDEVAGQSNAVSVLQNAALRARVGKETSHAWLITGPPGSGRSVAAKAFAAALLCDNRIMLGCGNCESCQLVQAGTHPDLSLVATEKVIIGIDEVRSLIGEAQTAPVRGQWRIMLIEDADRMVERTSNVLLKSIEEPPPNTIWILCAPSPVDVIATIRSRCRLLRLAIPSAQDIAQLLEKRDGHDHDTALAAAQLAQCHVGLARALAADPSLMARRQETLRMPLAVRSVGDAVLAAGRVIAQAKEQAKAETELRDETEKQELLRTLGVEGARRLPPAIGAQVRKLEADQKRRATRAHRDQLDRLCLDLASLYRDAIIEKTGGAVAPVNTNMAPEIKTLAEHYSTEQLLRKTDDLWVARRRIAANVDPLLAIEALMIALAR